MTRHRHDQFAKDLLKSLLEPLGQVTSQREVPAEALYIDVAFEGVNPLLEPADLERFGLLGRLVSHPCLFEPYRSPLRDSHLINAMAKLGWSRLEHQRRQSKRPGSGQSQPRPQLWILTPSATSTRLKSHALHPAAEVDGQRSEESWWERQAWPPGVYSIGTAWGFGAIVLDELPDGRETLLLRLLGNGRTQLQALEEVRALPDSDPLRKPVLHLLLKWRIIYREIPPATREEQEVAMLIDATYDEWITRTRNEGRNEGLRDAVLRAWRRRFGPPPPHVEAHMEVLASPEALESALEIVVVAPDAREAESALGIPSHRSPV